MYMWSIFQDLSQYLTFFVSVFVQADADSFYTACNGRQFNSIEEAVCQLIYVERAEVIKSEEVKESLFAVSLNILVF